MRSLTALLKQDFIFQLRHGFYLVFGIISAIYIGLLLLVGEKVSDILLPVIIFSDPTFIGFYFIGAILFFEREQRITEALFIAPVSKLHYILSKCISLTVISLFVSTAIIVVIHGFRINYLYFVVGVGLTSLSFIALGIIFSCYLKKITTYLIVGGLFVVPFALPMIYFLGLSDSVLFYVIPTTASLKLIYGGINGYMTTFDLIYSLVYLIIFFLVLLRRAHEDI